MKLQSKAKSAIDGISDVLAICGGVVIVFILVIVSLGVIMRYFVHQPLNWVTQLTQYSIVFITFLGAAWVQKSGKHVTMEAVSNWLKPRSRNLLGFINCVVSALLCLFLVFYGTQNVLKLFQEHVYALDVIEVPMAPLVAIIPLGGFLLLLQFLITAYGHLERWRASPKR